MLQPIRIEVSREHDVAVVRLIGQMDSVTSAQVEQELDRLLEEKTFKIVVDLGNVTYISSAGWGIFIAILKEIKLHDGDLKLAGLTDDVLQVFQLLEVDFYLPTHQTVAEAVKAFPH